MSGPRDICRYGIEPEIDREIKPFLPVLLMDAEIVYIPGYDPERLSVDVKVVSVECQFIHDYIYMIGRSS